MTIDIMNEIWQELKRYIGPTDRAEAADMLVNILIDNNIDPEDIRENFKGDPDVRKALAEYLDTDSQEEDEDYLEDLEDPDY